MTALLAVVGMCWLGCSFFAAYAHYCVRRADRAALRAEDAMAIAVEAAQNAKNAAHQASGFRRTRQGLR